DVPARPRTGRWSTVIATCVLLLSACGRPQSGPLPGAAQPTSGSTQPVPGAGSSTSTGGYIAPCPPAGSATSLTGAGATFPAPLYTRWFADYARLCTVQINYQSI